MLPRVHRVAFDTPVRVVSRNRRDPAWWRLRADCDRGDQPRRRERLRDGGVRPHTACGADGGLRAAARRVHAGRPRHRNHQDRLRRSDARRLFTRARTGSQARPRLPARPAADGAPAAGQRRRLDGRRRARRGPCDDARAGLRGRQPRPRLPRHPRPPADHLRGGARRTDRDPGHPGRLARLPLPLSPSATRRSSWPRQAETHGSRCRSSSRSTRPARPAPRCGHASKRRRRSRSTGPPSTSRPQRRTSPQRVEVALDTATLSPLEIAARRRRRGLAVPARAGRGGGQRARLLDRAR